MNTFELRLFAAFLLVFTLSFGLQAQELDVDVDYKMKKFKYRGKNGIAQSMTMRLNNCDLTIKRIEGDYTNWEVTGDNFYHEARFFSSEERGIWWELANPDETITVLLSTVMDDTNDPREYVITSDAHKTKYMAFNNEPDCNSEFDLIETADSPTNLRGIAEYMVNMTNKNPCGKGKWDVEVSLELSKELPENILLAFAFAVIQTNNIRHLEDLQWN